MKDCPNCTKNHEKPGIYCSRHCANSRTWSQEDKDKKSVANLGKPGRKGILTGHRDTSVNEKISKTRTSKQIERFNNGEMSDRAALRRMMTKLRGYRCEISECGISEWLGKPITLQVDHINGDAGDNRPFNLRLICANCHTQTATFGNRNKGKGRRARGLPIN
jgi:hypothetical protein